MTTNTIIQEGTSSDQSSWALLGLIRFTLATIVLCGHVYCEIKGGNDWTYFGLWFNQGSAVFGFLILSGYSIAASLERSREGFYTRRIVRIWPIYLLSIILALTITVIIGGGITFPSGRHFDSPSLFQIIATLFMLQTIITSTIPIEGQLWTLAIEWWLYMAAPFIKKLSTLVIAIFAIYSLVENITYSPSNAENLVHGQSFLCLSWYWLIGFMYYRHRVTALGYAILFFPIIISSLSDVFMGHALVIGVFAVALCSYVTIHKSLIPIMNWLGDLSYPLYCLHAPLLALCVFWHIHSSYIICFIAISASAIALQFVDRPIRQYFNKNIRTQILPNSS